MANKRIDIFRINLQVYDGNEIDITDNVASLVISESINNYFLEAELTIIDNSGILADLNIIGHERVIVHMVKDEVSITKAFRVARLDDVGRLSEHVGGFTLPLVSEHAYLNATRMFSRHFKGLNSNIIKNICKDYLDIELNVISNGGYSTNIVFPYIKPMEAITQILAFTYASDDTPLFLYERFWEDDIVLVSLTDILNARDVIQLSNGAIAPADPGLANLSKENQIEEFRIVSAYDTLNMLNNGVFANTTIEYDLSKKTIASTQYDIEKNITPNGQNWVLADWNQEYESVFKHSVKNSLSYVDDLPPISSTEELASEKARSYRHMMTSYNGAIIVDNNIAIYPGTKVDAKFPRFLPEFALGSAPSHQRFDHINSGEFIVAGVDHTIELDGGRLNYFMTLDIIREGAGV